MEMLIIRSPAIFVNQTQKIIDCNAATEEDWNTEYLAPILSIKIVDGLDSAIQHINQYSSQHTDSIVTQDVTKTRRFMREIDSASVMVNASTRFADGFEFGLGAEIDLPISKPQDSASFRFSAVIGQSHTFFLVFTFPVDSFLLTFDLNTTPFRVLTFARVS